MLLYFDYIVTGDEIEVSKPDPSTFFEVISKFPDEEKIYIIENSPASIKAAKETNALIIGFNIEKSNAGVNIKSHKELAEYFQEIN